MSEQQLELLPLEDQIDLVMLQRLRDIIEGGQQDIRGRHELFTRPTTPETATNLSEGQVSMCASFLFVAETFPEFAGASRIVRHVSNMNLSREGWSVEKANESYQLSETKVAQGLGAVVTNIRETVTGGKE